MFESVLLSEIRFEFTRSRGAGGQHVNRTESAAVLRWNAVESRAFTETEKNRVLAKLANSLNSEGELLVRSETHRDQDSNRKESVRKFKDIIAKALFVPKKRIKTKPTKSSQRKRLDSKRAHSDQKKLRSKNY